MDNEDIIEIASWVLIALLCFVVFRALLDTL